MTMRRAAPIVLTAILVFGCAGDPDDDLQADLAATREAQTELVARVADLERLVAGLPDVEVPDLTDIDRRVEEAVDVVEELRREVDLDRDARLGFSERVDDVETDLRTSLADLRDELQAIRAEIADLEIRYQVLQERLDRRG